MYNSFFENNYMIYFTVGSIINGISQLMILIASIILVSKIAKPGTYLILIGAILKIITLILGFIIPIFSPGSESLVNFQGINSILIGLSLFVFALGLILFTTQAVQKNKAI